MSKKRELKNLVNYGENCYISTNISDKGLRKIITIMHKLREDDFLEPIGDFADDYDTEIIKDLAHGRYYEKYLKELDFKNYYSLVTKRKLEFYKKQIASLEVDKKYKDNIKIKEFEY